MIKILSLANSIVNIGVCCLLSAAAVVDIRTRMIPNGIIRGLIGLWIIKAAAIGTHAPDAGITFVGEDLLGAISIAGALLCCTLLFERITHRTELGGGDIKLIFAVSLFLGPALGLINLFLACLGGIATSALCHTREFPFGPAIAASSCLILLVL